MFDVFCRRREWGSIMAMPLSWCVRLSRLLVGFRTHFKSLHFYSFHSLGPSLSASDSAQRDHWFTDWLCRGLTLYKLCTGHSCPACHPHSSHLLIDVSYLWGRWVWAVPRGPDSATHTHLQCRHPVICQSNVSDCLWAWHPPTAARVYRTHTCRRHVYDYRPSTSSL